MNIKHTCPECAAILTVREEHLGKWGTCNTCGKRILLRDTRIVCPACSETILVPEECAGLTAYCGKCGRGITFVQGEEGLIPTIEPQERKERPANKRQRREEWKLRLVEAQKWLARKVQALIGSEQWALGRRLAKRLGGELLAAQRKWETYIIASPLEWKLRLVEAQKWLAGRKSFYLALAGSAALLIGVFALLYTKSDSVPKDSAEAMKWYRRAAEQGDATAQRKLGFMYTNGNGVPKDSTEAMKWYRRAAEQGDALAQCSLGMMYHKGDGVPKDSAEAVKWYRRAAEQGDDTAQYLLGITYMADELVSSSRQGSEANHLPTPAVPSDPIQAYMWLNLAGQSLEAAREARDELGSSMTREQIGEAQRLSREWKPKSP